MILYCPVITSLLYRHYYSVVVIHLVTCDALYFGYREELRDREPVSVFYWF